MTALTHHCTRGRLLSLIEGPQPPHPLSVVGWIALIAITIILF